MSPPINPSGHALRPRSQTTTCIWWLAFGSSIVKVSRNCNKLKNSLLLAPVVNVMLIDVRSLGEPSVISVLTIASSSNERNWISIILYPEVPWWYTLSPKTRRVSTAGVSTMKMRPQSRRIIMHLDHSLELQFSACVQSMSWRINYIPNVYNLSGTQLHWFELSIYDDYWHSSTTQLLVHKGLNCDHYWNSSAT